MKINKFPGVYVESIDVALHRIKEACDLGLRVISLFPRNDDASKDEKGNEALNPDNLICRAIREIKDKFPDIVIMSDAALDPYTSHGHDGVLIEPPHYVNNDETVEILCQKSLNMAKAGCDIISPSDMMDGRVGEIRISLEENGFNDIMIFFIYC